MGISTKVLNQSIVFVEGVECSPLVLENLRIMVIENL